MILQEGDIIYDKRNHKSYLVEIAGSSQVYIKQVKYGALGDTACISSTDPDSEKKTIARDISTIAKVCDHGREKDIPFWVIGKLMHPIGTICNSPLFSQSHIQIVQRIRKEKGFIPVMEQNSCERIIKQACEQPPSKANKKPVKKAAAKKPSINKTGKKKK